LIICFSQYLFVYLQKKKDMKEALWEFSQMGVIMCYGFLVATILACVYYIFRDIWKYWKKRKRGG